MGTPKPSPRSRRRSLAQSGERRGVVGMASIPMVSQRSYRLGAGYPP
jgi:hypothetical protein